MIETLAARLGEPGGPHAGAPDKTPARRLATLEAAGEARVPFTTGILVGIGETRAERLEALVAIRDAHDRHGHVQEVIVQNFLPKAGTSMWRAPACDPDEFLWTIAAARIVLGADMHLQAPPNLSDPADLAALVGAGIDDWGGVSPVTPDHVNPERPWPDLEVLRSRDRGRGQDRSRRASPSTPSTCATALGGSTTTCASRCAVPRTSKASPATTSGRRAATSRHRR